jgi:hypothetical protein
MFYVNKLMNYIIWNGTKTIYYNSIGTLSGYCFLLLFEESPIMFRINHLLIGQAGQLVQFFSYKKSVTRRDYF